MNNTGIRDYDTNNIGIYKWKKSDGFLDIHFEDWKSREIIDLLSEKIRAKTWESVPTPESFQYIHRSSRMCHELLTENKITMIDREDADILHGLPLGVKTYSLNKIMTEIRLFLRETKLSISTADHFSKNIETIQSS